MWSSSNKPQPVSAPTFPLLCQGEVENDAAVWSPDRSVGRRQIQPVRDQTHTPLLFTLDRLANGGGLLCLVGKSNW